MDNKLTVEELMKIGELFIKEEPSDMGIIKALESIEQRNKQSEVELPLAWVMKDVTLEEAKETFADNASKTSEIRISGDTTLLPSDDGTIKITNDSDDSVFFGLPTRDSDA